MMFWLFIACIVCAVLIGVILCVLAWRQRCVGYGEPPADDIRLGEADWIERHPSIRYRRIEGHD